VVSYVEGKLEAAVRPEVRDGTKTRTSTLPKRLMGSPSMGSAPSMPTWEALCRQLL
jgi:hypothetical protein